MNIIIRCQDGGFIMNNNYSNTINRDSIYSILGMKSVKITVTILTVVIVMFFGGTHLIKNANASKIVKSKKITSVQVEQGQTLWSIADKYADLSEYKDYNEFIDDVKNINGLSDNTIHAGGYLIVPYFE